MEKKKFGSIFSFQVMGEHFTFLNSNLEIFFKKPDNEVLFYPKAFVNLFGDLAFVSPDTEVKEITDENKKWGAHWQTYFREALKVENLHHYFTIWNEECDNFIQKEFPKDSAEIELFPLLQRLILLTSLRVICGKEVRDLPNISELVRNVGLYLGSTASPIKHFLINILPFKQYRDLREANNRIIKIIEETIDNRRKSNYAREQDFLQKMMELGPKINSKTIAILVEIMLLSSILNTASTTFWTLFFLIENPQYMDKVKKEMIETTKNSQNNFTFDSILQATLLNKCIIETVRLQAPVLFTGRTVVKEQKYNDLVIPKNDVLCVSPYLKHREQGSYENPTQFYPEHFDNAMTETRIKNDPYAFIGFGLGRHKCLGEFYGYSQIKVIIFKLLKNYNIQFIGIPIPDLSRPFQGIIPPKGKCFIKCTKIN